MDKEKLIQEYTRLLDGYLSKQSSSFICLTIRFRGFKIQKDFMQRLHKMDLKTFRTTVVYRNGEDLEEVLSDCGAVWRSCPSDDVHRIDFLKSILDDLKSS